MGNNLGLKIFAIAAAIALNYYVNSETHISVVGFSAPVQVSNIPEDKILVWPLGPKVQVTVRGPSYLVSQVVTSNLIYELNVPEDAESIYRIELLKSALKLPPSVEVLSIEPTQLELNFDKRIVRDLPVVVPRYGNLPEDVKLVSMDVNPSTVSVSGPERIVSKLVSVETNPVDFRGIREDFSKKLELRNPGNLVEMKTTDVELTLELASLEIVKQLPSLSLEIRGSVGFSYNITPSLVTVEVAGPSAIVEGLTLSQVLPFVRISPSAKKGDEISVNVEIPEGVVIKKMIPSKVIINEVISASLDKK